MPDILHSSDSEESFHSFNDNDNEPSEPLSSNRRPRPTEPTSPTPNDAPIPPIVHRFSPEEEATLLNESNTLKTSANQLFGNGSFDNAIQKYDRALASCPNYLDYEIAVLRSNVAACHLKLSEWKEALESATKGIENLERLEPLPRPKPPPKGDRKDASPAAGDGEKLENDDDDDDDVVEEVSAALEARIARLQESGHTLAQVRKLQTKLLTRRAQARMQMDGWTNLQAADEDYKVLLSGPMVGCLTGGDRRGIEESVRRLGPKLNAAKEREMAEMMGKLKGLGNSLLGNFGLSTENFKFVKDEKSGGYSMNFEQNPAKGK